MNLKTTLNQKRFLILWISIHSFAFFVNVFKIDGGVKNTIYSPIINVFTTSKQHNTTSFWPFVAFYTEGKILLKDKPGDDPWIWKDFAKDSKNFFGIFNSYNFPEYIFYMCLGIGLIFIPKFWNYENRAENEQQK